MKNILTSLDKAGNSILTMFVAVICMMCANPMWAVNYRYETEVDNVRYFFNGAGSPDEHNNIDWLRWATVIACEKSPEITDITIPSVVEGHEVNGGPLAPISYDNPYIEKFTLDNQIIGISSESFWRCTSLKYVNLGEKVRYIGPKAFYGCTVLETITIPSTSYISENAFEGCTALTDIVITGFFIDEKDSYPPAYQIGKQAFTGCSALRNIVLKCTEVPSCAWAAFDADTYATATLFVPEGTLQAYRDDRVWGRFQHIVEGNNSSIIGVDAPAATDGSCDVYSLSGTLLRQGVPADSWKSDLAPGIYIVRTSDGSSRKAVVR